MPVQDDPALEAELDRLFRSTVDFIYDGQLDSAQAAVERAARLAPGDPRIGLFRFRVIRENYPDDLNEEERAKQLLPSIIAPLDQTVASCDSILEIDKRDPAGLLYRGWARMMKAQVYAIASEIWSAGTEARKGKGDLDRYLKLQPKDLDAGVIVGGYLYFADILPSIIKFVKFIVRIPGGDREQGLELLNAGAGADTYTGTDAKVVLGVIDYLFEGGIDEAIQIFSDLGARYPYNPRLGELLGSTAYVFPETSQRSLEVLNRIIDGWGTRVRGWDNLFLYRMLITRARVLNQIGDHQAARADLQAIVIDAPVDPYWIMPRALLGLSSLAGYLGQPDSARVCAQRVLNNPRYARYHSQARILLERKVRPEQQEIFLEIARARRQLFGADGGPDSARVTLARIRARHGDEPILVLLDGEVERAAGNMTAARRAYASLLELGNDPSFEAIRLTSLVRLGEIEIAERHFDAAKTHYEEARRMESAATLLGNMIRGRLRFIDEKKEGKGSGGK